LEVGYRIQLNRFLYIQPDIQYIVQPGGTGAIPNTLVLGAQIGVSF
jgi:porin